jgi:hypothetical protein
MAITTQGYIDKIGAGIGLVALLMVFVGFFVIDGGGSNGPDQPVLDLAAEITAIRGRIVAGSTVGIVGGMLFVGFVASLRIRLARAGLIGDFLSLVAYTFGVVVTIGALVHGSFRMATSVVTEPNRLVDAILPLSILKEHITDLMMLGIIGLVVVMSISGFAVNLLPRVFAGIGIGLVVTTIALIPAGLGVGVIAIFFWLMAACAVLIGNESTPRALAT